MFVDNSQHYGLILKQHNVSIISEKAPFAELFLMNEEPTLWKSRYLQIGATTMAAEECHAVYSFPAFSDQFCADVIGAAEKANVWSKGLHADERVGGYENVPTQDTHTQQFGWQQTWKKIVKQVLGPHILRFFPYTDFKADASLSFVVRYSMTGQRQLRPHQDHSLVTTTIVLNDDFQGGGVHFLRYNCTIHPKQGFVTIHPGQVTHTHEAKPILSGTRYVLVSFNW